MAGDEGGWTPVSIEDPSAGKLVTAEMRLTIFSPPIIIEHGVWPASAGPKPFWFEARDIMAHLDKHSYAEVAGQMTKENIDRSLYTENKFEKVKANYDPKRAIPPIVSLVLELDVKWKGRTLAFIVSDIYEMLTSVPKEDGHAAFTIDIYELVGSKWKIQSPEEVGILKQFIFVNPESLSEIMDQKRAKLVYGMLRADGPKKK